MEANRGTIPRDLRVI